MTEEFEHYEDDEDLLPSKTQLKKESLALQTLGDQLTQLSDERLAQLPLSDSLHEAIVSARKMKANSARKRQIQYIGKLIRSDNADDIIQALEDWEAQQQNNHQLHKVCEQWRDQLLEDDNQLQEFFDQYPAADRQQLRQLIRNHQKSKDDAAKTKNKRKLFEWLRDFLQSV